MLRDARLATDRLSHAAPRIERAARLRLYNRLCVSEWVEVGAEGSGGTMNHNGLGAVVTLRASPLCGSVQNAGAFCRTDRSGVQLGQPQRLEQKRGRTLGPTPFLFQMARLAQDDTDTLNDLLAKSMGELTADNLASSVRLLTTACGMFD